MKIIILALLFTVTNAWAVDLQEILPEVPTTVRLSNTDNNRIHCDGHIKDVIYSDEKGLTAKVIGQDIYVKFKIMIVDGQERYVEKPNDLYIVCGNSTFTLIAIPVRETGKTIKLKTTSNKMVKNRELFKGKDFEEVMIKAWIAAYTEDIPESFVVTEDKKLTPYPFFRDLDIRKTRTVRVEGEGIEVRVFDITAKSKIDLLEQDFMIKGLVENPLFISIEPRNLQAGDKARLFIIEKSNS